MKWISFDTPSGGRYMTRAENVNAIRLVEETGTTKEHGLVHEGRRHFGGDEESGTTVSYDSAAKGMDELAKAPRRKSASEIEIGPRADALIRDMAKDPTVREAAQAVLSKLVGGDVDLADEE